MRNPSSLMRIKLYDEVNGIRRDGLTYVEINTEKTTTISTSQPASTLTSTTNCYTIERKQRRLENYVMRHQSNPLSPPYLTLIAKPINYHCLCF